MSELKKARSVKEILRRSIEDIQNGLWICGSFCSDNTDLVKGQKPMGCAVGLVAINDGVTADIFSWETEVNRVPTVLFEWTIPEDECYYSKNALKAIDLLDATKRPTKEAKQEMAKEYEYDGSAFSNVIVTNDHSSLTSRKAVNWFKRALALAEAK